MRDELDMQQLTDALRAAGAAVPPSAASRAICS